MRENDRKESESSFLLPTHTNQRNTALLRAAGQTSFPVLKWGRSSKLYTPLGLSAYIQLTKTVFNHNLYKAWPHCLQFFLKGKVAAFSSYLASFSFLLPHTTLNRRKQLKTAPGTENLLTWDCSLYSHSNLFLKDKTH